MLQYLNKCQTQYTSSQSSGSNLPKILKTIILYSSLRMAKSKVIFYPIVSKIPLFIRFNDSSPIIFSPRGPTVNIMNVICVVTASTGNQSQFHTGFLPFASWIGKFSIFDPVLITKCKSFFKYLCELDCTIAYNLLTLNLPISSLKMVSSKLTVQKISATLSLLNFLQSTKSTLIQCLTFCMAQSFCKGNSTKACGFNSALFLYRSSRSDYFSEVMWNIFMLSWLRVCLGREIGQLFLPRVIFIRQADYLQQNYSGRPVRDSIIIRISPCQHLGSYSSVLLILLSLIALLSVFLSSIQYLNEKYNSSVQNNQNLIISSTSSRSLSALVQTLSPDKLLSSTDCAPFHRILAVAPISYSLVGRTRKYSLLSLQNSSWSR